MQRWSGCGKEGVAGNLQIKWDFLSTQFAILAVWLKKTIARGGYISPGALGDFT